MVEFLQNKHTVIYWKLCDRARSRRLNVSVERHHVIPKSLGGSNELDNVVQLTPREHFICHKLLVKMTEGKNKSKMVYALWRLTGGHKYQNYQHITGKKYEQLKLQWRETLSTDPEHGRKISLAKRGVKRGPNRVKRKATSDETRQRMRLAWQRRKDRGEITSEETIQKIKETWRQTLAKNGGRHPRRPRTEDGLRRFIEAVSKPQSAERKANTSKIMKEWWAKRKRT